ncbi:hypothetical protein DSECCO2_259150 [anaerobic digester metagenome]
MISSEGSFHRKLTAFQPPSSLAMANGVSSCEISNRTFSDPRSIWARKTSFPRSSREFSNNRRSSRSNSSQSAMVTRYRNWNY